MREKRRVPFLVLGLLLKMILGTLYSSCLAESEGVLCDPRPSAPVVSIAGEAIITALLDGHAGENCSLPVTRGLQQMAAAAWAVSSANSLNIVPGVKLGLEVFDTCSNEHATQLAALSSLSEVECGGRYSLGVLTTEHNAVTVRTLLEALDVQLLTARVQDASPSTSLAVAAATLVRALNRSEAAILSNSVPALRAFSKAATQHRVCVTWEELLPHEPSESELVLDKLPITGTVVIVAPWAVIRAELSSAVRANASDLHWVLAPTDQPWENFVEDVETLQLRDGTLLVAASAGSSMQLDELITIPRHDEEAELERHELPGSLMHEAAIAVLGAVRQLQAALSTDCGDEQGICPELRPLSQQPQLQTKSDEDVAGVLVVPPEAWSLSSEPEVRLGRVLQSAGQEARLELLATLQPGVLAPLQLMDNGTAGTGVTLLPCETCVCLNTVSRDTVWHFIRWRHEVWVATITSVAAVGVVCAIAVAVFIAVRICKGDVLEGNPTFSFVLLLAVVVAYVAVLPFCAVGPRLLCALRELGAALGHALLLSTMLARSLMLATTDDQGFMSHVNGFLQAVLWFFIIAVQVAMTAQMWVLHAPQMLSVPTDGDPEHGGSALACSSEGAPFLLMLSYDMFLLLLLLLVCPLVARSKRNYREGLFFSVATVLCSLVWLAWLAAYVLAPPEWRAPAAAAGLVAAATAVLVAVFIPRTYLMVSSVARARIASALPCTAAGMNSSSVLDINYRSSHQALYDSVNTLGPCAATANRMQHERLSPRGSPAARGFSHGSTGLANPNYYSEHPEPRASSASTVMACGRMGTSYISGNVLSQLPGGSGSRDRLSPSPENTYERYDSPPSPHKVTRF